jgi:bacteriorhodopsin
MTLSPDEAADALRDIAATETHSRQLYAYREASPHLILWGVLWGIGYALTSVVPLHGGAIWSAIITVGSVAGYVMAFRAGVRRDTQAGRPIGQARRHAATQLNWTYSAIQFIAALFIAAALVVVSPVSPRQIGAFIPLVVAAGYSLMGLWLGVRFIAMGIALTVLTLGGFFLLPAQFPLWMAAVGGGALVLGGIWLRRA